MFLGFSLLWFYDNALLYWHSIWHAISFHNHLHMRVASGSRRSTQLAFLSTSGKLGPTSHENPKFTLHETQIHPKWKTLFQNHTSSHPTLPFMTRYYNLPSRPSVTDQPVWLSGSSKATKTVGLTKEIEPKGQMLPGIFTGRSHRL